MTSPESVSQPGVSRTAMLSWHGPAAADRALAAWLGVPSVAEIDDVAAALAEDERCRAVLICPAPLPELSRALASGTPAARALADWCETARALLVLQRRHRRRLRIVSTGAPEALGDWLEPAPAGPPPQPDWPDALQALLARSLLMSSPEARGMAEELEAAGAGALLGRVDTDAALAAAADLRRAAAEAGGLREGRRRLLRQVFEIEAEISRARFRETALEARVADLDARLATAGGAQAELDRSRATEGQLRDNLAESRRRLAHVETRLQETEGRLEAAETERDRLARSNLQLGEGLDSQQALLREAETRAEALTDQLVALHGVREELETWFFRAQAEESRRAQEAEAAGAAQASLQRSVELQRVALEDREARLARAEAELARYRAGWLARLGGLFGRKER